jgi:hypothetical protein
MCAAWAPTPRSVVARPPVVSLGGADWPALPWHASHAVAWLTWTTPSMWFVASRNGVRTSTDGWHGLHCVAAGCGGPGGRPWQAPHAA